MAKQFLRIKFIKIEISKSPFAKMEIELQVNQSSGWLFNNMNEKFIFLTQNTKRKLRVLDNKESYKITELPHPPCNSVSFYYSGNDEDKKSCVECVECQIRFYGEFLLTPKMKNLYGQPKNLKPEELAKL